MQKYSMIMTRVKQFADDYLPLLGRLSIGSVFWQSGQTKVQGFVVDLVGGHIALGWPRLSDSAVDLFQYEYKLPLLPPEIAAIMGATAEHILPFLLFIGLGTRFAALGLLGMTAIIEIFVYPDAWPTHGTWATILLLLIIYGGGKASLDALIAPHLAKITRKPG